MLLTNYSRFLVVSLRYFAIARITEFRHNDLNKQLKEKAMGVSAKCLCQTDNKNVFEVAGVIEKALRSLTKKYKDPSKRADSQNKIGVQEMSATSQMLMFNFTVQGEERLLHVHFSCDCDSPEFGDKKLICSLGAWGLSDEIITTVAKALQVYGDTHVMYNDASSEGYTRLDVEMSA